MALVCMVGPAATFDAVAYARGMAEDDAASPVISDARYATYLPAIAADFSRFVPLDVLIGNPVAGTSPLNTVAGQQRYVCSSANGFTAAPVAITVIQTSSTGLNAANDSAYFFLNPYATAQGFLGPAAIDNPSSRIIRDSYLGELDAYGRTNFDLVRDQSTGLMAIDLYPIPQAVSPIYVRYQANHVQGGSGNALTYATVPEDLARCFADLLYAQILLEMAVRIALTGRTKAGLIEREGGSAGIMRDLALDVQQRVYQELGGSPVALAG